MDPTDDEVKTFTSLTEVLEWSGLAGDPTKAAEPQGALMKHLGVTDAGKIHPRAIGAFTDDEYKDLIRGTSPWKIGGRMPSPIEASQAGLFGRACRVAVGTQVTPASIIATTGSTSTHTPVIATATGTKNKMSSTTNTIMEAEIVPLDATELKQCYDNYSKVFESCHRMTKMSLRSN